MKVIPSMWVVNKTTDDDGKQGGKVKSRLVVRGDQDMNDEYTPCDSPTVDRTTVKMMIDIAANQEWQLRTIDIPAAFLQGREIDRTIYVLPPPEVAKAGIIWKLKKGWYGLKEAARLWFDELTMELIRQGGKPMTGDPACFLFHKNDVLVGFAVIHVDDIIVSSTQELVDRVVGGIKRRFKVSKDQIETFIYTGMAIRSNKHGRLYLNQNQYLEEMEVPQEAKDESVESLCTIL